MGVLRAEGLLDLRCQRSIWNLHNRLTVSQRNLTMGGGASSPCRLIRRRGERDNCYYFAVNLAGRRAGCSLGHIGGKGQRRPASNFVATSRAVTFAGAPATLTVDPEVGDEPPDLIAATMPPTTSTPIAMAATTMTSGRRTIGTWASLLDRPRPEAVTRLSLAALRLPGGVAATVRSPEAEGTTRDWSSPVTLGVGWPATSSVHADPSQ